MSAAASDPASACFCREVGQEVELVVAAASHGQRLDQFLARHGTACGGDLSRARFQELIAQGLILVDDQARKNNYRLKTHQRVSICIPPPTLSELAPEPMSLAILHEDAQILVLSKPPGLVVHPACGNLTGTLVHGLLHHCSDLSGINGKVRPGIVHRLDKDTSGVMVIAKTDLSHHSLAEQFKQKNARKTYHAILDGVPAASSGVIRTSIGRHPIHRKKMAVVQGGGKEAITRWRLVRAFGRAFSLVEVEIETGRTHQIRVHMAFLGVPVAGDAVYGKKNPRYQGLGITRQCLHASTLSFRHPGTNAPVTFIAELAADMQLVLANLRGDAVLP